MHSGWLYTTDVYLFSGRCGALTWQQTPILLYSALNKFTHTANKLLYSALNTHTHVANKLLYSALNTHTHTHTHTANKLQPLPNPYSTPITHTYRD